MATMPGGSAVPGDGTVAVENRDLQETTLNSRGSSTAVEDSSTLHGQTMNRGRLSMQENTSYAEMVIMHQGSAVAVPVPVVKDEIEALHQPTLITGVGSSMKDSKSEIIPRVQAVEDAAVDIEAAYTPTTFICGQSTNDQTNMQIIPAEDTSVMEENIIGPIPIQIDAIASTPTKRNLGRPMKILGSPSTPKVESNITIGLHKSPATFPPRRKPSTSAIRESIYTVSLPKSPATFPEKRKRGRPPGSGKLQKQAALGACAESVTPRLLLVQKGEDIIKKLDSIMGNDEGTIYIMSGVGHISSVHIQSGTSRDGVSRHEEGPYTLLNLSGTYGYHGETAGRSGFMTVMLSNSSCQVIGGLLVGGLVAAGPVRILFGNIKDSKMNQLLKRQCVGSPSQRNSPRIEAKVPIIELADTSSSSTSYRDENEDVDSN